MNDSPCLSLDLRLPLDRFDLDVTLDASLATPLGVFGPSGGGKSSLLAAIAGLRPTTRGRIVVLGRTWLDGVRRVPTRERQVGWVPQNGLLFPHLDVEGNLLAGASARPGEDLEQVIELLRLESLRHRPVRDLSGGERQRVALGRAICARPAILLLDEPFASLDLPTRRQLASSLRHLLELRRVPAILVSHDPLEIQALCGRVVILHEGRIRSQGDPYRVLTDPEIFPLARRLGFANLLAARIESRAGQISVGALIPTAPGPRTTSDSGLSAENVQPAQVRLPTTTGGDTEVLFELAAADILIARSDVDGLSARNRVPCRISSIDIGPHGHLVHLEAAGGVRFASELTSDAVRELDLEVGSTVVAIFKTSACRIFEARLPAGLAPTEAR